VLSFDERHRHCLFVGDDVRAPTKAIGGDVQVGGTLEAKRASCRRAVVVERSSRERPEVSGTTFVDPIANGWVNDSAVPDTDKRASHAPSIYVGKRLRRRGIHSEFATSSEAATLRLRLGLAGGRESFPVCIVDVFYHLVERPPQCRMAGEEVVRRQALERSIFFREVAHFATSESSWMNCPHPTREARERVKYRHASQQADLSR
jgi:hypothetical protein